MGYLVVKGSLRLGLGLEGVVMGEGVRWWEGMRLMGLGIILGFRSCLLVVTTFIGT